MSNLVGQQIGKYELTSLLGRGGMADVYGAFQPGLERMVAIKVLEGYGAESPEMIARFKREARSVALLRHTNIVQVFDFEVEGDRYYMVMEYIKGGTLGQLIRDKGALPIEEALSLAIQLADGLYYAHQRGIVHRDIKPVNIMFADSEHQHPVITDFGIAYILNDPVILTAFGRPLGSPVYISPEVARREQADERSDIYSFGVTLYEMLTGRIPFDASTSDDIIIQHINASPPSPRQFNASLTSEVEAILLKMLAKRREQRFQNASELKNALQIVHDRLDTRPLAAGLPQPVSKTQALYTEAENGIRSIAPLELAVSSPVESRRRSAQTIQLIDDETPESRRRRWPFILLVLTLMASCAGLFALQGVNQAALGDNVTGTEPAATTTPAAASPSLIPPTMTLAASALPQTPSSSVVEVTATLEETAVNLDQSPRKPNPVPAHITSEPTGTMTPSLIPATQIGVISNQATTTPASVIRPTNVPQQNQPAPTNAPQPTQVPPTSVPATNPPAPTQVPPTSVPPTTAPLIPPVIPTLLHIIPGL